MPCSLPWVSSSSHVCSHWFGGEGNLLHDCGHSQPKTTQMCSSNLHSYWKSQSCPLCLNPSHNPAAANQPSWSCWAAPLARQGPLLPFARCGLSGQCGGLGRGMAVNALSVPQTQAMPYSPCQTQCFALPLKQLENGSGYWLVSSHQIGSFIFMRELAERGRVCQVIPGLWLGWETEFLGGREWCRALGAVGVVASPGVVAHGVSQGRVKAAPALHRESFQSSLSYFYDDSR